jgi:hypothetical protein
VYHTSGSYVEIFPDGSIITKSMEDSVSVTMKDHAISVVKGDLQIVANEGMIEITSDKDINLVSKAGVVNIRGAVIGAEWIMSIVIQLPTIPKLECPPDGKISQKELDAYFKNIGRTISRLELSVVGLDLDDECSLAVIAAVLAIDAATKPFEEITTKPLDKLKSKELEFRYRARELGKDIEEYFKKKVSEILLDLIELLGIPNPFEVPIPFIGTATLLDDKGNPYVYDPVIADLFTKEGQRKVKLAIKEDIEEVKKFLGIESTYDGKLGIKSPDLEAEEVWHKVKNWFNNLINDFIGSVANAIAKAVKAIPIIGKPIYDLITAAVDPTITVEQAFDKLVAEYKAKIAKAKEDVLSGKAIEDLGQKNIR